MSQRSTVPSAHIPALDGLRGVAVGLVLLFHCFKDGHFTPWVTFGWVGVDLFFVLSGFLITGILLDTRGQEGYYRRFIIRRALRVFPLYYLMLAAVFLLAAFVQRPELSGLLDHQLWFWTYTPNLLFALHGWGAHGPVLDHFWSLGIEEQFYLVWPWIVVLAGPRKLGWVIAAGVAMSIAWRCAVPVSPFAYTFTLARLDGLLMGAGVALGLRLWPALLRRCALPAIVIGGMLALAAVHVSSSLYYLNGPMLHWGIAGIDLLFAGLLILLVLPPRWARPLVLGAEWRPLRWLGRYSYGLYVYHWPLFLFLFPVLLRMMEGTGLPAWSAWWCAIIVFMGGLIAVAVLSYRYLEAPLLGLKERWAGYPKKQLRDPGSSPP